MVALSAQSPSTVRVFLSALKRFYSSVLFAGEYPYAHPSPIQLFICFKRLTRKIPIDAALVPRCRRKVVSKNQSLNDPRTTTFVWWTRSGLQNPSTILHVLHQQLNENIFMRGET